MFATGACGLVVEYIPQYGFNLHPWKFDRTVQYSDGLMMLMMGIAGFIKRKSATMPSSINSLREMAIAILGGFARSAYAAYSCFDSYLILQYLMAGGIGFLIGFEIPLVIRINQKYVEQLKANVGDVFVPICRRLLRRFIVDLFLAASFPAD
jgi:spermidine synthase